jgi:hypothetical protein
VMIENALGIVGRIEVMKRGATRQEDEDGDKWNKRFH